MDDTGRLTEPLTPAARRIVFGDTGDHDLEAELRQMTRIDFAHVVSLVERAVVPAEVGKRLLTYIMWLREKDFAPLRGVEAPRGLYLMYEDHLIHALGKEAGGSLHTGRSRNDLKAATLLLRLRDTARELIEETLRLQAVLLRRGERYRDVVMPVYTHFQPAVPVTYGHYLLGVATAVDRDLLGLVQATGGLRTSPMGACGVGGTDLPLDPARVARLLGFDQPSSNSIDAVASRDTVLRLLFAATSLSLTLSRLATDAQLWSTQEFALLDFPDNLVGSSSIMPQKRNVFLLEHIKAKPAIVSAAAQALVMACKGTPFTNSIEVGTEGVTGVWPGLRAVSDAVVLSRLIVGGAIPAAGRMTIRAEQGRTTATATANRLVRDGVPFRQAHHLVGALVRQGIAERGRPALSPAQVVREAEYGGGPGPSSLTGQLETLSREWTRKRGEHLGWGATLRARERELDRAVTAITGSCPPCETG